MIKYNHIRLGVRLALARGVTPIPSALRSATAVKQQANGQGIFKAKDYGQMFLVDGQSYANKVVRENIAKINGIRSKVKIKF